MRQHIVHDPSIAQYAIGVQEVWTQWEPWLDRIERLLTSADITSRDGEDVASDLRRAQYRAHTAHEFTCCTHPPIGWVDAHEYLVSTLSACRETLGALVVRAELYELDELSIDVGLHAVSATREAFRSVQEYQVAAAQLDHSRMSPTIEPWYHDVTDEPHAVIGRGMVWPLLGACMILLGVLGYELFLLTAR